MRELDLDTEYKPLWKFLRRKSRLLFEHESTNNKEGEDVRQTYIGQIAWTTCFVVDCDNGDKVFYCISPIFFHVLSNDLPTLMITHPHSFGQEDAIPILLALGDIYKFQDFFKLVEFLTSEKCCYIVKQRQNGSYVDAVLRLDLFRQLQDSLRGNGKKEFVGGVLHAAKHFDINHRLFFSSTHQFSVDSLFELVYPVVEGFFKSLEFKSKNDKQVSGTAIFGKKVRISAMTTQAFRR